MDQLQLQQEHASDRRLRRVMRIVGVVLVAISAFFLTRDIFHEGLATWFFGISAGLGGLIFVSSWLPDPRKKPDERGTLHSVGE